MHCPRQPVPRWSFSQWLQGLWCLGFLRQDFPPCSNVHALSSHKKLLQQAGCYQKGISKQSISLFLPLLIRLHYSHLLHLLQSVWLGQATHPESEMCRMPPSANPSNKTMLQLFNLSWFMTIHFIWVILVRYGAIYNKMPKKFWDLSAYVPYRKLDILGLLESQCFRKASDTSKQTSITGDWQHIAKESTTRISRYLGLAWETPNWKRPKRSHTLHDFLYDFLESLAD